MWLSGIHSFTIGANEYRFRDPAKSPNSVSLHDIADQRNVPTWVWCPICTWCLCPACLTDCDSNSSEGTNTFRRHSQLAYPFLFDYPALAWCRDIQV
jgi:hypothetical protein